MLDTRKNQDYALKLFKINDIQATIDKNPAHTGITMKQLIMNEVDGLKMLVASPHQNHPNILKFHDFIENQNYMCIVTNLISGPTLLTEDFWKLYRSKFKLSKEEITRPEKHKIPELKAETDKFKMKDEHILALIEPLLSALRHSRPV